MAAPAAIVIGGKGSSLSSTSIYSICSSPSSTVGIDSSVLERLSCFLSKKSKPSTTAPFIYAPPPPSPKPLTLTPEESRASLLVLLNKLLLSVTRPDLPLLIQQTLNSGLPTETIDFSSPHQLLHSILNLNGKKGLEDFVGVTVEEVGLIENSFAVLSGISAVLDCNLSALVVVIDAVAALSCEAAKVDVAVFDLPVSSEGFSVKDGTDVASDMKDLLFGSKFVGHVDSDAFSEIPMVHGSFRGLAKSVHAPTRIELNSIARFRKPGCGNSGKGKALVAAFWPLAMSIRFVGECSLGRAKLIIESIDDAELQSQVVGVFEESCPGLQVLRNGFESVSAKDASETDFIGVLHGIYDLTVRLREILSWEAALALFVLDLNVPIENTQVGALSSAEMNGGNVNVERKNVKKKKVIGKGTSVIRQLMIEKLKIENGPSADGVIVLVKWMQDLSAYFDPKHPELDVLLKKVKAIVESNEVRRLPKIPKGTRDFGKEEMAIRERAFSIIVEVFKRHGGVALDTPVFELRETLMGKYGEDSKLIYDLADQGGEICSLRYDLTVPFARYLAMHNINALKRYQIAKVYRRDNPSKGRYREFYQCDFDIAGQYEVMEPDFEVIKVLTELLGELNIGDYEIKLNHRKLLDGMLEICGVSPEKFRTVCSSIDKLDKQSFEQVKKELVEEKGLAVGTAEKIGLLVKKKGPPLQILSDLKQEGSQFLENDGSILALNELEILFRALEKSKCIDKVSFDLSLARGLDYYTGVIFEAVFKGGSTQVGSIAAGGRYDNLVGIFSGKQVPAVGVSLGIERVFTIMEQLEKDRNQVGSIAAGGRYDNLLAMMQVPEVGFSLEFEEEVLRQLEKDRNQAIRPTETQVLVVLVGKDLALVAELVSELWNAKIKAEFAMTKRVMKQIDRAKQSGIPWMVIVGDSEIEKGVANIKDVKINKEVTVPRDQVVQELQRRLDSASQLVSNRHVIV